MLCTWGAIIVEKGETLAFVIYDAHAAEVAQMWPRVLLILSELGGIIRTAIRNPFSPNI